MNHQCTVTSHFRQTLQKIVAGFLSPQIALQSNGGNKRQSTA
jgi:hypothetical protein